jgi:hypothetical protein
MICGSCPYTDGMCYTSLPPKVRCDITGEYHYYDDECNCIDVKEQRIEARNRIKELLNRPGALMAVNYDSDKAPAISITGEEAALAYDSLIKLPTYDEADGMISVIPNTPIDFSSDAWKLAAPVEYGATPCLVCGEAVGINTMFDNRSKVCKYCQKTIKFIKERFKEELDNYEV